MPLAKAPETKLTLAGRAGAAAALRRSQQASGSCDLGPVGEFAILFFRLAGKMVSTVTGIVALAGDLDFLALHEKLSS